MARIIGRANQFDKDRAAGAVDWVVVAKLLKSHNNFLNFGIAIAEIASQGEDAANPGSTE